MKVKIELERETDARWIADVPSMGVLVYGATRSDAISRATEATFAALAADLMEHEERAPSRLTLPAPLA